MGSVHVSGDGFKMTLGQVRKFVEYTQRYPATAEVKAGVIGLVGHGLSIGYEVLQGLEVST